MYTDQAYKRTQPKPKEEKREGREIRREGGRRERREGIGKEGGERRVFPGTAVVLHDV